MVRMVVFKDHQELERQQQNGPGHGSCKHSIMICQYAPHCRLTCMPLAARSCIIDRQARKFDAESCMMLANLGEMVGGACACMATALAYMHAVVLQGLACMIGGLDCAWPVGESKGA